MATKFGVTVFNGKLFNLSNLISYGEKSKHNAFFTKTVEYKNYNVNNGASNVLQLVSTTKGILLNRGGNDTTAI